MYLLFRGKPPRTSGSYDYPEMMYIRRKYVEMIDDVKQYYRRNPKHVDASNQIGNILVHIKPRPDLNDYAFVKYVEDVADGLIRTFGFTSSIHRGKVHVGGITLGDKAEEIMISSSESFDLNGIATKWTQLTPVRYLYHTRTDVNLPIMNNRTPGKAFGVTVINVPMLALQYRYWLKYQTQREEGKESVYRFVGSVVLPNMIDSFLEVAFFNRMARQASGIGSTAFPSPHPFYLTDMSDRLDRVIKNVNTQAVHRSLDIEQLAAATPMIQKENLFDVMALPRGLVTRQNEWALLISRLPYVKYLASMVKQAAGTDRSSLNDVLITLIEAKRDSIFSGVGNSEIIQSYNAQIEQVIDMLK